MSGQADVRGAEDGLAPLRADVRLLGDLLGAVLTEADGVDLLDDVERLRHATQAARDGGDPDTPARIVAGFTAERAEQVARAFTVYFHLANLAEERHRVRVLRARDRRDAPPTADSLAAAIASVGAEHVREVLPGLELHPVLTAHPTEARRRAVVTALRRIADLLDELDDPRPGASEQDEARRRLREEVTVLWRTAQLRAHRPGPLDEVRTAMAVFDETLFRLVPVLYRSLDTALLGAASGTCPPQVPPFLRLGSWVGGDRDGNPHVTAEVTRAAVDVQADHVLRGLENATVRIGRTLTLDAGTTPPSRALRDALAVDAVAHPRLLGELAASSPGEPHRQKMLYAAARIAATRTRDADLSYRSPDQLLADLRLVQDSLARAGATRVAYGEVQHLVWQVQTFGFHLADLEVRQHSRVHAAALRALVGEAADDAAALDRIATDGWPHEVEPPDEQVAEVLATLRVMAVLQDRWGPRACRRYVVSFSHTPADLVGVAALARLALGDRPLALDVVPLFETGDDLRRAVEVLDAWVALPGVAGRLAQRGRRLEVMLGYSDSAKDVGPLAATLALYDAQAALVQWAHRHGLELTLFHGRGGSLGRGGGPVNRAILAQPPGSVAGRFKVTEQGEVVFARYGNAAIARRHLEQVASAVLAAGTQQVEARNSQAARRFAALAATLADRSRSAYRALVETDGFAEFVARVSPLEELGELQIGSRPARRSSGSHDLDDLRAIPWVFAWAQTRCNLPGWYGVGTALAAVDLAELREAYAQWPLFRSFVDNAEMSLAKTYPPVAARYLRLGGRPDLAERLLAELDLSVRQVLAVLDQPNLLAGRTVLGAAVALRNPYVDALSHLQLRALGALRAGALPEEEVARLRALLLLTVNGVAAGLQNTG